MHLQVQAPCCLPQQQQVLQLPCEQPTSWPHLSLRTRPLSPQEFRRTKNDCGDCPCIHDDNCRKQYEELDDRSKDRYG